MTDAHTLTCPGDDGCTCVEPGTVRAPHRAPSVFMARCTAGHVTRGTADQFNAGRGYLRCDCGLTAPANRMDVQHRPTIPCGPRCWRAHGTTCHCACAGVNHGTALAYTETRKPRLV